MQYVRDIARIFIRCAEAGLTGAKVYTPRGDVMRVHEFLTILEQILPAARALVRVEGNPLPVAFDFDDSTLHKDLPGLQNTPLIEGIRETAAIFERLNKPEPSTSRIWKPESPRNTSQAISKSEFTYANEK